MASSPRFTSWMATYQLRSGHFNLWMHQHLLQAQSVSPITPHPTPYPLEPEHEPTACVLTLFLTLYSQEGERERQSDGLKDMEEPLSCEKHLSIF